MRRVCETQKMATILIYLGNALNANGYIKRQLTYLYPQIPEACKKIEETSTSKAFLPCLSCVKDTVNIPNEDFNEYFRPTKEKRI